MRLTGPEIKRQIAAGIIEIEPFDESRVQGSSVDLTLGRQVRVYEDTFYIHDGVPSHPTQRLELSRHSDPATLDVRKNNPSIVFEMTPDGRIILNPGVLYLMHTAERVHSKVYEWEVTGKSSIGRLGIIVHHTAAHCDPGFNGQITLEVAALYRTSIPVGWPICQVRFMQVVGEVEDYTKRGNYVGDAAMGAQASRSWKQSR